MEIYQNSSGEDCVKWEDEQGATHSMLKIAYDEMMAQNADKL